jgi:putative acetyltransferase
LYQPERIGLGEAMQIRDERSEDASSVRAVNLAAFETAVEAELVDAVRDQAAPIVSLVAEDAGTIVGHILFSPVTLVHGPNLPMMGLAPMAVVPDRQRQGIGSRLVLEGLERCRRSGVAAVVVVGHPAYYPRFGFVPGSRFGIGCEYDVPDDVFLIRELHQDALRGLSGTVRYHPAFAAV